jgi:hypothetical protein
MSNRKLTDKTLVEVYSNSTARVGYYSEMNRVKRLWEKIGSIKKITLEELKELADTTGGFRLLDRSTLLIKDNLVREELGLNMLPEYIMGEQEISLLLTKTANEIKKVLEIAPSAIIERIAMKAIEDQITDIAKMEVIKQFSGIDVLKNIQENIELKNKK